MVWYIPGLDVTVGWVLACACVLRQARLDATGIAQRSLTPGCRLSVGKNASFPQEGGGGAYISPSVIALEVLNKRASAVLQ